MENAIKKYDDLIYHVFYSGSLKSIKNMERALRPERNMGWNIAEGGSVPPRPAKGTWGFGWENKERIVRRGFTLSDKTKHNMSKAQLKRYESDEEKMFGHKNPMYGKLGKAHHNFKCLYHTPAGIFESQTAASIANGVSRAIVAKRCKSGAVIKRCKMMTENLLGKTWQELGWFEEYKTDDDIIKAM